jgi:hypothetical protein
MGKKLSAAIARFERDGLVFPVEAFSDAKARHYRECLEGFERSPGRRFVEGHNFKPHIGDEMKPRLWPAIIGLLLSLLIASCGVSGNSSDNDKQGGFYGGVTGGGSRP